MTKEYVVIPQTLTQAAIEWMLTMSGAKECEPYQTIDIERLNGVEDELAKQVSQWLRDRKQMTDVLKDFKETYYPGDIIEVHERSHIGTRQDNWSYPSGGTYTVVKQFSPVDEYRSWQQVKRFREKDIRKAIKADKPTDECVFWMYLFKEVGVAKPLEKPQVLNITDVINAATTPVD